MKELLLELFGSNPDFLLTILIIISVLLLMVLVHQIGKYIYKFVKKKSMYDVKKIIRLEHPLLFIIVVLGVQAIVSTYLRDYPRIHSNLNSFLISLSIILITYMLSIISHISLENWSKKIKKNRNDETHEGIIPLMKSVVDIILGFVALIFILQTWEISVGALLTSLGIASVIIGFAFRDSLTNIFGGIALVLDDTFRKGDLIELPDGEVGFIMETSLRSTKLKNFDLEEIYVPNSVLANMKIRNYAQPTKSIRLKIIMPVSIGTDVEKVEKLIFDMLDKRQDILKYPRPKFFFVKVAEYYLELMIGVFINDYHDLFVKKSEITKAIYSLLIKNKIEIPVPARKIYSDNINIKKNTKRKR